MKIVAIPRAHADSPNMSDKDMALFHLIAEKLSASGHCVEILRENEEIPAECDTFFHMTRTPQRLEQIAAFEATGRRAINSSHATRNCSRKEFTRILTLTGIKQPPYTPLDTGTATMPSLKYPGWLKKSIGWSLYPEDVQYITTDEELKRAMEKLRERGITEAIYSEHIEGDLIKFYGIKSPDSEEDFFRLHYPTGGKFGQEKINGTPHGYAFDEKQLRATAFKAATAIGLEVFGGDCIVTPDGEVYIIDINDFPSFSAYREEAAEMIAELITKIDNLRMK